jgi:predicted nucleic-acid-binding protein
MRVAVDTNVLIRYLVNDDVKQADKVEERLRGATEIYISIHVLCELVWVLSSSHKYDRERIIAILRALEQQPGVTFDRASFDAGMAMFVSGADFADGVILHHMVLQECDTLLTFDRKLANRAGRRATLLI